MKPEASRRPQTALLVASLARVSTARAQDLADPAGSGVLVSAVNWLLGTVATVVEGDRGGFGRPADAVGRINWHHGATVILGCFILFGAASTFAGIQSTATLDN